MEDLQAVVAERIKKVRRKKGITQDQLAEMTGLSRSHVFRLEAGRQSMTLRTLQLIAENLGVRVRDLIGYR